MIDMFLKLFSIGLVAVTPFIAAASLAIWMSEHNPWALQQIGLFVLASAGAGLGVLLAHSIDF